jgi:hypothetical protein
MEALIHQTFAEYSSSTGGVIYIVRHCFSLSGIRSGSMCSTDRRPLVNGPAAERIQQRADNRLGAVYSALYSFWAARHAAGTAGQQLSTRRGFDTVSSALYGLPSAADQTLAGSARADAYSVVFFNDASRVVLANDLTSNPDQLLDIVLGEQGNGRTNFAVALRAGQSVMLQNWSIERFISRS